LHRHRPIGGGRGRDLNLSCGLGRQPLHHSIQCLPRFGLGWVILSGEGAERKKHSRGRAGQQSASRNLHEPLIK
jgi:hypothetical protein